MVREEWEDEGNVVLVPPDTYLRRNSDVSALAQKELGEAQLAQKHRYDAQVKPQEFQVGQKVLFLLPSSTEKLLGKYQGPFELVA